MHFKTYQNVQSFNNTPLENCLNRQIPKMENATWHRNDLIYFESKTNGILFYLGSNFLQKMLGIENIADQNFVFLKLK